MKSLHLSRWALSVCAGAVLFAGCGGSQGTTTTIPTSSMIKNQSRPLQDPARSGIAPEFLTLLHFAKMSPRRANRHYKGPRDVFVSDFGTDEVEILMKHPYREVGTISSGLDGADGDFLDTHGNLYVADYVGVDIQEYSPGGASPSFTYNAGMKDPVDVSVDTAGNVYEADNANSSGGGFVNEYAQGSSNVINSCSPGVSSGVAGVEGVAVDKAGDVFVAYNTTSSGGGGIAEYKGGLKGCRETILNVTLDVAGGMVLDRHDNLIVCDQTAPAVDVIDPPYTHISGTLGTGYEDPFHVTLGKWNDRVFIADPAAANVQVLGYPSGALVTTLNEADGLSDPAGAVSGPNAVH